MIERKRTILNVDLDDTPIKKVKIVDDCTEKSLKIDIEENLFPNLKDGVVFQRPDNIDYVSVTLSNGTRCYINTKNHYESEISEIKEPSRASEKYYNLLDEAENILRMKNEIKNIPNIKDANINNQQLWVSKYSPKKYSDLLSSETVNRNLLLWLKCWDKYVFNKEVKVVNKYVRTNPDGTTVLEEAFQLNPHDNRPMKKAVLLCGPPGIGKTTLAQILSRHCGYKPQEMNASDERNPDALCHKLEVISTNTTIQLNKTDKVSATSLIIDEIDGMTSAAVQVLINALTNQPKKQSDTKNRKQLLIVKRPIICICNDLYAPSLKLLRPHCFIIRVEPPDYSHVKLRLTEICDKENLIIDSQQLLELISISSCDVRSCLNTLQFIKSHQSNNSSSNLSINICKDQYVGLFNIWESIFLNKPKKRQILNTTRGVSEAYLKSQYIQNIVNSSGNIDQIVNGVFENYLSLIKFKDLQLNEMTVVSDWFLFNDLLTNQISANQQYELIKYKLCLPSFIHISFASISLPNNRRITWPLSDSNAHFNQLKMKTIFDSFISKQIKVKDWFQNKSIVLLELLPYLIHIIRPLHVRSINAQLHTEQERATIQNIVSIMVSLGLDYIQEKTHENLFDYILAPPIEDIILLGNSSTTSQKSKSSLIINNNNLPRLTYATKQLLATEIQREKIRQSEEHMNIVPIDSVVKKIDDKNKHNVVKTDVKVDDTTKSNVESVSRLEEIINKENVMKLSQKPAQNNTNKQFFSFESLRVKNKNQVVKEENHVTTILKKSAKYKFKEGFTNAIRRPLIMKDL